MDANDPNAGRSTTLQPVPDARQTDSQMAPTAATAAIPPTAATAMDTTAAATADITTTTAPAPAPQPVSLPNPPPPTIPPRKSSIQSSHSTSDAGHGQIPPPPKANEMPHLQSQAQVHAHPQFPPPQYRSNTDGAGVTTTQQPPPPNTQPHAAPHSYMTNPHQHSQPQPSQQQPPAQPQSLYQNLEHPPGYIQNPVVNAHTSHDDTMKPEYNFAALGMGGRWVWDPAPGEAGGRYVYEHDYGGGSGSGGARGGGAGYGQHQSQRHRYGGGHDGDEDDGIWPDTGVWESTKSWMRTAGSKLVEAEEGVWRWVNSRT